MEWQTAGRRKRGSLTEQLFDLAVNTGSSKFLDWARKAKDGKLGEDKVAQAWEALRRKPAGGQVSGRARAGAALQLQSAVCRRQRKRQMR